VNAHALLLLSLLASLALAQATPEPSILVTAPRHTSSDEVELGFVLTNPYPEPEGLLVLSFNAQSFELRDSGANCTPAGQSLGCTVPITVLGQDEVKLKLGLKRYFERESVDVRYVVPARQIAVGAQLFLTNQPEPGTIAGIPQLYLGGLLAALALGVMGLNYYFRSKKEAAAAPAAAFESAGPAQLPDLPAGASLLLVGPVESTKADLALRLVERSLDRGSGAAWCSFDGEGELASLPAEKRARVARAAANPVLEETGIVISRLAAQKPGLAAFDVLRRYAASQPPEKLLKFIAFNLAKLREAGVASAWLAESTMDPRALASLEGEFDLVMEFIVRDEKGRLQSYVRAKKSKGKPLDTRIYEWS
jgi:hypothetical protein